MRVRSTPTCQACCDTVDAVRRLDGKNILYWPRRVKIGRRSGIRWSMPASYFRLSTSRMASACCTRANPWSSMRSRYLSATSQSFTLT